MLKIAFIGAGSTVFAKNILGDSLLTPALQESELALYDIDNKRLDDSLRMLKTLNSNINQDRAAITAYTDRREALQGADYVINAIQVGGYEPCTVIDFQIPKKYGLKQTIGDTLGVGGIFRALRTIPVVLEITREMEEVCPEAWFLNYTNPMAMVTGAILKSREIKTVGLCHSVQVCAERLLKGLEMSSENISWKIAGINHMAWLLEIKENGRNIYPEIKRKARKRQRPHDDMVRYKIMELFGYYCTESSEHVAEYLPYFIKDGYPELIEEYNIPLDEYPRRCEKQIADWEEMREELVANEQLKHTRSKEYASLIMEAMETGKPLKIGGNVLNTGLITNLPAESCVEVPCIVDREGINPCYIGQLPEQLAALNRTNINVQLLTIKASLSLKKEYIYQAALLDPHTAAELSVSEIIELCDDMLEAERIWLPDFR